MPHCPKCKREITDENTYCPDCGTRLVMSLPVESSSNDDSVDAILLLKANNSLQAELLASALEEEGIPFLAKGLGIVDGLGGVGGGDVMSGAFSSPRAVEIWVNPRDLDRAKELMAAQSGSELGEDESVESSEENSDSGSNRPKKG